MPPLATFLGYEPSAYLYYKNVLDNIHDVHGDTVERIIPDSIFPAMSINFPGLVACEPHKDHGNLADGFCWLMAGGNFDSRLGGHLYLEELNILIEFPAGSAIFFPSAVIAHGNAALQEGETRWSITQYAAGGLFRWAEYGYHSLKSVKTWHKNIAGRIHRERPDIWKQRLELLSTPASLHRDRAVVRQVLEKLERKYEAEWKAQRAANAA